MKFKSVVTDGRRTLQLDDRNLLTFGGEYRNEKYDSTRLTADAESHYEALYLQDEWLASPKWIWIPSVRYDHSGDFGGKTTAKLGYFHNHVKNLIDYEYLGVTGGLYTYQYYNVARATIQGLEAEAEQQLGDKFVLKAGYTYLDAYNSVTDERLANRKPVDNIRDAPFIYADRNVLAPLAGLCRAVPGRRHIGKQNGIRCP